MFKVFYDNDKVFDNGNGFYILKFEEDIVRSYGKTSTFNIGSMCSTMNLKICKEDIFNITKMFNGKYNDRIIQFKDKEDAELAVMNLNFLF